MVPTEFPACKAREILKARVRADLKVYADAVSALHRNVGRDFTKAHQYAERARMAFEAGSKKLADHLKSHGCG